MKSRLFILILFLIPGWAIAQDGKMTFTIKEAQEYALQNSKTYKNAQADVQIADAQIKEARGAGLPKVEGTVDYMTNFGYELEFNFGGGDTEPPEIDYTKLDFGDYEILKLIEGMSGGMGGTSIKMTDQASANVQISQLIFSGQYWVGLEMAKLGKQIREKSLTATAIEVKEQVKNASYLILVTRELLKVIQQNEENLKEIYQHTKNLYDAGMAELTDVDQIKINISQLANSKRAMERNLQLNFNMFRMVLGLDPSTQVELNEELGSILSELDKQFTPAPDFNPDNNINYQLLAMQEKIGEKSLTMQKWSYAPTLVGFYNYKEKILRSQFDMSPNHAAGFTMSIPIFSGGSKNAQLSQARIELEKTVRTKELLKEQLELQNNQLTFNLTSAYENYKTQAENVEVAQRVFDSMKNKYQEGMISSLELTQANANYLQAENNYVSSMLELLRAQLDLDKLNNNL